MLILIRSDHLSHRPLFAQFCCNDAKVLLSAARYVEDTCDAVDLNFGCPQRIAKKGRYGAFLMDDLDHVEAMVTEIATGLKVCSLRTSYIKAAHARSAHRPSAGAAAVAAMRESATCTRCCCVHSI